MFSTALQVCDRARKDSRYFLWDRHTEVCINVSNLKYNVPLLQIEKSEGEGCCIPVSEGTKHYGVHSFCHPYVGQHAALYALWMGLP